MEEVKRPKPIVLHDEETGQEYTLEFNRDSIRFAESRGFVIEDVGKYPMTKVYELFFYSFRMHHKNVSREKTDRLIDEGWGGLGGIPEGVIERLGELYAAPFIALTDGEEKNARLTVEL